MICLAQIHAPPPSSASPGHRLPSPTTPFPPSRLAAATPFSPHLLPLPTFLDPAPPHAMPMDRARRSPCWGSRVAAGPQAGVEAFPNRPRVLLLPRHRLGQLSINRRRRHPTPTNRGNKA